MTFLRHFGRLSGRIMIFAVALLTLNFPSFADNECPITVATFENMPDPNSISDGDCALIHVEDTNADYVLDTVGKKWLPIFTINIEIPSNSLNFQFSISASGTFNVNCGTDGVLGGTGVSGNAIDRSSITTNDTYTCTYSTYGTKSIVLSGAATGYSTASSTAAISFYAGSNKSKNAAKIKSINGSLGAIFKTLNDGSNDLSKQPRFSSTFYYCSGLTSLPDGLFNGISGAANNMFQSTFSGCSGLTTLPSDLFNGISGAAESMFSATFSGCSGLTSLPDGLFDGISGAADYMFFGTFGGCSGLTSLPDGLFNGISGAAKSMFYSTFRSCTGLTSLPDGLFNGISGAANNMFYSTFYGCSGLTSLPSDLFDGISGAADYMFDGTFSSCSGLTSLPDGLFNGISGVADYMFSGTFFGCSGLNNIVYLDNSTTTYLPYNFFGDIDMKNNAVSGAFSNIFNGANANFSTTCPAGTALYTTAYDSEFNGKVLCQPATYTVNYDCNNNGGGGNSSQTIDYGFKFNNESNCTYAGHTLQSWSCTNATSGDTVTLPANNTAWTTVLNDGENINCVANWGNTVYTINFKDADSNALNVDINGTPSTSTTWTFGDEPFTLPTPTDVLNNYEDKLFNGWFSAGYTLASGDNLHKMGTKFDDTISAEYIANNASGKTLNIYGQLYKQADFKMTTVQMGNNDQFMFTVNCTAGKIYIDWGDGHIEKHVSNGNRFKLSHIYQSGVYKIGLYSENITDYCDDYIKYNADGSIAFYGGNFYLTSTFRDTNLNKGTPEKLARIEGDLSAVFPTIEKDDKILQPYFSTSFYNCVNLEGPIPENLFAHIYGQPYHLMFRNLFSGCTKLGTENGVPTYGIPEHLFCQDINDPTKCISGVYKDFLFSYTFNGCSGLKGSIPEHLFGNISGAPAPYMFYYTFGNCSNLTGPIPDHLFGNISGAPATYMFSNTFEGCEKLSGSIPGNLFGNISGAPAPWMYNRTFYGCKLLTGKIPDNLLGDIKNGPLTDREYNRTFEGTNLYGPIPEHLLGTNLTVSPSSIFSFRGTFKNIPNIMKKVSEDATTLIPSSIPSSLFSGITGTLPSSSSQFLFNTFTDTLLTGANPNDYPYLKKEMFSGITGYIANNEFGNRSAATPYTAGGMAGIFSNAAVATTCPAGMYQYLTGFEADWDGRVACEQCPTNYTSESGNNVNISSCYRIADRNGCPEHDEYGGTYYSGRAYYAGEGIPDNTDACLYEYTITYNGIDGVQASFALTTYNKNTTERTLPTADIMRKPGAIFAGWLDANDLPVTEIPADARGPLTYTAQWNECPNGSYCDGLSNTPISCSTLGAQYTKSDTNASIPDNCYRDCIAGDNYDVPHATAVTGSVHYSADGEVSTCAPADENSCTTGYEYQPEYVKPDLPTTAVYEDAAGTFLSKDGNSSHGDTSTLKNGEWTVSWDEGSVIGTLKGTTSCNNIEGVKWETTASHNTFNGDETGSYCWCQPTEWNGQLLYGEWIYRYSFTSDAGCDNSCVSACVHAVKERTFGNKMAEGLSGPIPASCSLKTYTITYHDGESETISEYNVEMESVQLATPTKAGYTFDGWYTTDDYQADTKIDSINTSAPSNLTLYAKWTKSCADNQVLVNGVCSNKFILTTTATNSFKIRFQSSGTFYIDCGDDGTLYEKDTVLSVNIFNRETTALKDYYCKYPSSAERTITLAGKATGYISDPQCQSYVTNGMYPEGRCGVFKTPKPAVFFESKITSIQGSLGAIFPTIGDGSDLSKQPRFVQTFANNKQLTALPAELFDGIHGVAAEYMFKDTFRGCTGLTSVPEGLFSGISVISNGTFSDTFMETTNLTVIPANLFSGMSGTVDNDTFWSTFESPSLNAFDYGNDITTNYIPKDFFGTTTCTRSSCPAFYGTQIATVCEDGMFTYKTYGDKVSCDSCPIDYTSQSGDNDTIYRCYNNTNERFGCPATDSFGGTYHSGRAYYAGEDVPDNTDACLYEYTITYNGIDGVQASLALTTYNKNSTERTLPTADIMRKPGAIFNGWVDGNGNIATEIPADARGPVTYTAQWNECPNNSFCDGSSNTPTSCSTATNGVYPLSETGSTSINDCYRNCVAGTDVPNATAATGSVHYSANGEIANCAPANANSCATGYEYTTTIDLNNIIGLTQRATDYGCLSHNGAGHVRNTDKYNIDTPGTFAVDFGSKGIITGTSVCATQSGTNNDFTWTNPTVSNSVPTGSGANCWCALNGLSQVQSLTSSYVFFHDYNQYNAGGVSGCLNACAGACGNLFAGNVSGYKTFRAPLFNTVQIPAICSVKTYTITYNDGESAHTVEYNVEMGNLAIENLITTPTKADYAFGGWYDNEQFTGNPITQITAANADTLSSTPLYAKWTPTFTLNVNISSDSLEYNFLISASGTFNIDCGNDGALDQTGTGVSGNVINRSSITAGSNIDYACVYNTPGPKNIVLSGKATGYSTDTNMAVASAIKFYNKVNNNDEPIDSPKIQSVSGSLGAIFPTIDNATDDLSKQPRFAHTFQGAVNLHSVPGNLFDNVTSAAKQMFWGTFEGSGLESLPNGLFAGISGSEEYLFDDTFKKCESLTTVPADLFGTRDAAKGMFRNTFNHTGIETLPNGLFAGINNSAEDLFLYTFRDTGSLETVPGNLFGTRNAAKDMFFGTFDGSGLTSIPSDLFAGINGSAETLFILTFSNCASLKTVPGNLFGTRDAAQQMFFYTFANSGLESLPVDSEGHSLLFKGINKTADLLFGVTFVGCESLANVPADLFGERDASMGMFYGTFAGSGLTNVPSNLFSGINGSELGLFSQSFESCKSLKTVPADLFGEREASSGMFGRTFADSGLTVIPSNLFAGISGTVKEEMFSEAFVGTTDLTYVLYPDNSTKTYLPYNFFGDIDMKNNAVSGAFSNIFNGANANFSTSCPTGTTQYTTVYDDQFNGKVLCEPVSEYTITFNLNGGTGSETVTYGADNLPTNLPTPNKANATFGGWYDNEQFTGNPITQITAENADTLSTQTLYARWTCNTGYEEQIVIPDFPDVNVVPSNYQYRTGSSVNNIDDDLEVGEWKVKWATDNTNDSMKGSAICTNSIFVNVTYDHPAYKTYSDGYTTGPYCWCKAIKFNEQTLYSNWLQDINSYSSYNNCLDGCASSCAANVVTNDVFRSAIFGGVTGSNSVQCTPKTYKITYENVDGATNNNPTGYNYESETITLQDLTKDGYTFTGWTINNEPVTQIAHNSTGDKTITANWSPIEYTITYELDGGENAQSNPSTYTIESANITLATPTKDHAGFDGWYDINGNKVETITTENIGDKTLTARWTCNDGYEKQTLTLPDSSLQSSSSQYRQFDSTSYSQNPDNDLQNGQWKISWDGVGTMKGIAHCGSEEGNNNIGAFNNDSSNWLRPHNTFDGTDDPNYESRKYCWCKPTEFGGVEVSADWGFVYPHDNAFDCSYYCAGYCTYYGISFSQTLRTALFDSIQPTSSQCVPKTYTITYENVSGATNNADNPENYTYESETITLQAPTDKPGYTFTGWTMNGEPITQIAHNSTGDKTLTANWTAVNYSITYETHIRAENNWLYVDVNMPEDVQYSYNTDTEITLPVITSTNYTFGGWYDNEDFEGDAITTIPAGSMNDKTFYAKWTHVTCDEGYYLAHDGVTCDFCPEDSYCPGGAYALYTDVDQGNQHCPEIQNPYGAYNISYYRSDVDVPSTEDTCMVNVYFSGEQDLFAGLLDTSPSYDATLPLNINSAYYNVECRYNQQTEFYDICRIWALACKKGYYVPTLPESIDAYDTSTWYNINDLAGICVPAEQNHYTKSDRPLPEEANEGIAETEQSITELESQIAELEQMDENEILPENNKTVAEYLSELRSVLEENQLMLRMQNAEILMFQTAGGSVFNFSEEDDNNIWYYDYVTPLGLGTPQESKETLEDQYGECPPEYPNSAAGSWAINQCYATVTFDANNDTNIQTETYYYSDEFADGYMVTLPEPEGPDGLSFGGWFDEEGHAISGPTALLQGDKDFTAIWEVNIYTISYELGGGTNNPNNPSTYTIESENITLSAPEKDGYMFVGWYDNEQFTGDAMTTIPTGSTGDKTLYAKWEENCSSNIWWHIGEGRMCLSTTRGENTGNPVLVVQIDGVPYYGMMTPVEDADLPISKCEDYHLKINVNGTVYSVHDKTVNANSDNMAQCGGACPLYYNTYEELPLDKTPDDLGRCDTVVATNTGTYCSYNKGWHCYHSGGSSD